MTLLDNGPMDSCLVGIACQNFPGSTRAGCFAGVVASSGKRILLDESMFCCCHQQQHDKSNSHCGGPF